MYITFCLNSLLSNVMIRQLFNDFVCVYSSCIIIRNELILICRYQSMSEAEKFYPFSLNSICVSRQLLFK